MTPIYEKALSAAIKNEYRWDQALKIYNLFVGNEIRGDFATRKKMWELYIHNQDPKNSKLDSATYGWLFELAAENKAEGEGLTLRFRSIRKVFDEMMASNLKPSKKLYSNTMQALATDRYSSLKWRQLMLDNNIFTSEQVGTEIGRNIWSHFAMIEEHCENSDLEKAFELYEEVLKSFPNFHLFPSTFTKLLSLAVKNRNFPFAEKVITDTILKLTKSKEQRNTIFLKNVMRIGSNLGLNYKRNSLVYLVQEQSIKYLGKVDKNFEVSLTLLAGQPDRVEKLTKLKRALSAAEKDSSL